MFNRLYRTVQSYAISQLLAKAVGKLLIAAFQSENIYRKLRNAPEL